ncbi:MAG: SMC-Scp complex subunit ScpB [Pseudomonadota bacterium]
MDNEQLKHFLEAALLAASDPLNIDALLKVCLARPSAGDVTKADIREALKALTDDYSPRGIELIEVASGFRIQVRQAMGAELVGLFEERPPRYSRAFFETLALIAYRQPITRGEIEDVRGVAVSSNIIRSMLEREWVRVVGHRDVPGKPAMFGTTKAFLDYFNLKKLDDLPSLAELTDIESLKIQLDLPTVEDGSNNPPAIAQVEAVEDANDGDAPADVAAAAESEDTVDEAIEEQAPTDKADPVAS